MKDDVAFNIKFISLIEERPCLYDFYRSDYRNRNIQESAWLEIATILKESVDACKERWKNLRGCYTRHLKNNTRQSGSSAKPVKPYYLAEHLQFLDRYTKPRQLKGIFNKIEQNTEIEEETRSEIDEYEQRLELDYSPHTPVMHNVNFCDQEGDDQIITKRKKVSLSEVNAAAMTYLQQRQVAKHKEDQDPDSAFLYSLLPDMKEMNNDQKRRFKIGVLKLAEDILKENT